MPHHENVVHANHGVDLCHVNSNKKSHAIPSKEVSLDPFEHDVVNGLLSTTTIFVVVGLMTNFN